MKRMEHKQTWPPCMMGLSCIHQVILSITVSRLTRYSIDQLDIQSLHTFYHLFSQARVALYKDGSELFSIMFDASSSNNQNWFTKDRVISSPWTDLKSNLPQYFSITGANGRRFYISGPHFSCDWDHGWLSITQHHCAFEKSLPITSFIYSSLQTNTNWNVQGKKIEWESE